jgi:hypothetical protein
MTVRYIDPATGEPTELTPNEAAQVILVLIAECADQATTFDDSELSPYRDYDRYLPATGAMLAMAAPGGGHAPFVNRHLSDPPPSPARERIRAAVAAPSPEPPKVVDLMAALEESIRAAQERRS